MKTLSSLLAATALSISSVSWAQPAKTESFEEGMRQAYAEYKKGNHEAVTLKLRELTELMENKGAVKVSELLPSTIGDWKGETLRRGDLSMAGGGISMERTYVSEKNDKPNATRKRSLLIKVVKDSPLLKQLLPLMANEDLVRMANRKTHSISGKTAIMEGEHKMQIVLDGRILIELAGDGNINEKDLLEVARKLDLNALEKMK